MGWALAFQAGEVGSSPQSASNCVSDNTRYRMKSDQVATIHDRSYLAGLAHYWHRFAAGPVLPVVRSPQAQATKAARPPMTPETWPLLPGRRRV